MYKNKMKLYRQKENMKLNQLANKTGISIGYLSHLEKETRSNPSIQIMEDVARALNRDIIDVFFDNDKSVY